MRPALIALLLPCLGLSSLSAWADTLPATSRITAVTVYPEGAEVTREVTFALPGPGTHDIVITDLPESFDPALMRLDAAEGLTVGAFSLRSGDRMPPRPAPETAAQTQARAAVEAAEAALAEAEDRLASALAQAEAAEAQVAFLRSVTAPLAEGTTADDLRSVSGMIGAETRAAREAAIAARAAARPLERGVADARRALDDAQAALDALPARDDGYAALSVQITADAVTEGQTLTLTHYAAAAQWRPVYDLRLTTADTAALTVARGLLVAQDTGEDWTAILLTLSTARPSEQAEPSRLWPELRRITDPAAPEDYRSGDMVAGAMMEEPVMEVAVPSPKVISAGTEWQGQTVVYRYPDAVSVASGFDEVRLALDEIALAPDLRARAVPRMDETAFLMARADNGAEILLPGNAFLFRDGVLVGGSWLEGAAPGAALDLAFGPIDTLRLTREMPQRNEGDAGVIFSSSERTEEALLRVENTGDRAWPVEVIDQIPYSEQEDLEITFTADPAPDEQDVKGERGILAWRFDLSDGESREIRLTHRLSWPEGMVLE